MNIKRYLLGGLAATACAGVLLAQTLPGGNPFSGRTGGSRRMSGATDAGGVVYRNGDPYGHEPDGRLYSLPRRPSDLSDRHGVPQWEVPPGFRNDTFTFARVNYHSNRYSDSWATDYPDSDLNLSARLQVFTTFKTNPTPVVVKLTDPTLFDYPFIYMVEVATLEFEEDDIPALRRYLLNGGFLMVDNFFGATAWENFHKQMQRVFPDRQPRELDISHQIFHIVFDLKDKPQIPKITNWARHQQNGFSPIYPDTTGPHYWAYFDDKGRMMALICHNTDLGNGWSRELSPAKLIGNITLQEGSESDLENDRYFHEFSEQYAYPMAINILFYALTH